MSFDINKFISILTFSCLLVIIVFTNVRICFGHKIESRVRVQKEYEGEGCDKLKYINPDDDVNSCPGEGTFALAQKCLEYIECIQVVSNSSKHILDYFLTCEDNQYFNGTGCEVSSEGSDCSQMHCRIVEVSLESDPTGTPDEPVVTTMVDDAVVVEATTEINQNATEARSSKSTAGVPDNRSVSTLIVIITTFAMCSISKF